MKPIGWSTGCLIQTSLNLIETVKAYSNSGANALEISFGKIVELEKFELTTELREAVRKFSYVSIHAPWNIQYPGVFTHKTFEKLESLCSSLPVQGIVVHPSQVSDFAVFEQKDLPWLMENIIERNSERFGTHPEHFEKLKRNYNFGFVFDSQHAYENDSSMNLAMELIEVMGGRLKHMHISGMTGTLHHAPVYAADNRDAISRILDLKLPVPVILEGSITDKVNDTLAKEFDFIKRYDA